MVKKVFFIAIAMVACVTANAQYTKYEPDAVSSATEQQPEKKTKKDKAPKAKKEKVAKVKKEKAAPAPVEMKMDAKYGIGACPVVDDKIQWSTTINCPGLSAKQIYDRALAFLAPYCKEKDKDENSQIALVNPTTHEIGARIGEYVVFTSTALSLDRAMLHYTLCLYCADGKCKVVMKSLSYKYEGNDLEAEEMLLDENAINMSKGDFYKGGYKKFRTKTIDSKDILFQKLSDAINKK